MRRYMNVSCHKLFYAHIDAPLVGEVAFESNPRLTYERTHTSHQCVSHARNYEQFVSPYTKWTACGWGCIQIWLSSQIWMHHMWMRRVTHMGESCHTCERVPFAHAQVDRIYVKLHSYVHMCLAHEYGVALVSRIDKIIGLFCKRALQKRRYSAKETSFYRSYWP